MTLHADRNGTTTGPRAPAMRPAALALSALFGAAAVGIGALWVAQGSMGPLSGPDTLAAESVRALGARDYAAAEQAITSELAWGERRGSAWCRLAFTEYARKGRFTPKVTRALLKSYEVAPYDAEAFAWRLQFIFDHWEEVPSALRREAMGEARAFHAQWATRPTVEALIPQVRDPTGQFALRLAIRGAEPKSSR